MDPISQQLLMGAAGAGGKKLYVEDVFSTWLYTGNGSTQTITNGIDLSGKGGLVWIKNRSEVRNQCLYDTARGIYMRLETDNTSAQSTKTTGLTSFNADGFTVSTGGPENNTGNNIASWTFRKAAKFFDVVSYVGNGSTQSINHSLGSVPGCMIVKATSTTTAWYVYHRGLATPSTDNLTLNETSAADTGRQTWNSTTPTSTQFFVNAAATGVNANGVSYVAYLFAHDAGGFGDSGNESVIKCGNFTTDGSGNTTVDLGWEPQWVLFKRSDGSVAGNWYILDNMRGWTTGTDSELFANLSSEEGTASNRGEPTSRGFTTANVQASASFIYIAIRRGPMKTPTDATKVYTTATQGSAGDSLAPGYRSTFPVDFAFWTVTDSAGSNRRVMSRMQGINGMYSDLTNAEASFGSSYKWDYQNGFWDNTGTGTTTRAWMFRRAPGFFDVVCYAGTGSARTVSHNLGVAPELMIVKGRGPNQWNWNVYHAAIGATKYLLLDSNAAEATASRFNDTAPTASVFSIGTSGSVNSSSDTYVTYLFATCPGVSKVGNYTGTGTTLNVDCGFTAGARFVLIKRTDSTGDWYVWDTARGIVSGNDPYLRLNSSAAEVTNTDYIDPLSSGFQISSTAPAAINANGGSFIFLAIA